MEKWKILIIQVVFCLTFKSIYGQENVQPRIPKSLVECYKDAAILERDNRLPMTIDILIDLIRKIENPHREYDIQKLAPTLLHRFRQDGIKKARISGSESVLPFSPSGFQFPKFKILLSRLIPGDARTFPNDTLTVIERCSLHFMMSSTVETRLRGDESVVCNQLSRYRAMRVPRSANKKISEDVELFYNSAPDGKSDGSHGETMKLEMDERNDPEDANGAVDRSNVGFRSDVGNIDASSDAKSQCPFESGVIWTPWGAISGGNLLAGIAAGLQHQSPSLKTLLQLSPKSGSATSPQVNAQVSNIWGATFAGDLAELALLEGPSAPPLAKLNIGAEGVWNSTYLPRWYFLTQNDQFEVTDAEIRGSLDGLKIAANIANWKSSMKLSQLLDMYYSQRGVLNTGVRSCDRRSYLTEVAPVETTKTQTRNFATLLGTEMQLEVTIHPDGIGNYSENAANALFTYIPESLNDISCQATKFDPNDDTTWRAASALYIFIDSSWPFRDISQAIAFLLSNIDVNPYGTNVTLLNSMDGKIIVNSTYSLSDIYQKWNITTHMAQPIGLNLPIVLETLHNVSAEALKIEKNAGKGDGRSLIALIVPQKNVVNEADTQHSEEKLQIIREEAPDLEILFLASGAANRFARFVKEEKKDIFIFNVGDNVSSKINPLVQRIREIPRRITNPKCGERWESDENGPYQMEEYVEPGSVNFYRLQPNYFFRETEKRLLRIQKSGQTKITVCHSRNSELPRRQKNATNDVQCVDLAATSTEIDISNPCEDASYINKCNPLYISVEAGSIKSVNEYNCNDRNCRFPDNVKFSIQTDNLGCYSNARCLLGSAGMVLTSILLRWLLANSS